MFPVLVIVVGFFISSVIRNSRPEIGVVTPVKKVTLIRGVIAKKTSFQPVIHAQGTVQAKRQIELVPEVAGKIIWVSPDFAQGGLFSKGDKLVLIDPRNYEFAVARAQASVADARNKLVLEEAEAELAKTEWEDLGGGEASPLVLRVPQMATARAKLASAKADLDRALLDLERTVIKAPFDGRVEEKKVDIGQYVSLGSQLAVLYSTDVAEISLPLTDRELGKLDLQLIYGEQNKNKKNKQLHDYYQNNDNNNKADVLSIMSMEIGESEGLSQSCSHQEDNKNNLKKLDSKVNLKRVLGIHHFENQETQKQNMDFLKENK